MIDVRRASSRGGVILRDRATRQEVFVDNGSLAGVAAKLFDEAQRVAEDRRERPDNDDRS